MVFGNDETGASNSLWSWKEGVGLSTLVNGIRRTGDRSLIAANDDRIFFGADVNNAVDVRFWTWKEGVGLSTIASGINDMGRTYAIAVQNSTGRVSFGSLDTSVAVLTWQADTGLSTIATSLTNAGAERSIAVSTDGRVYFGQNVSPGNFYSWSAPMDCSARGF